MGQVMTPANLNRVSLFLSALEELLGISEGTLAADDEPKQLALETTLPKRSKKTLGECIHQRIAAALQPNAQDSALKEVLQDEILGQLTEEAPAPAGERPQVPPESKTPRVADEEHAALVLQLILSLLKDLLGEDLTLYFTLGTSNAIGLRATSALLLEKVREFLREAGEGGTEDSQPLDVRLTLMVRKGKLLRRSEQEPGPLIFLFARSAKRFFRQDLSAIEATFKAAGNKPLRILVARQHIALEGSYLAVTGGKYLSQREDRIGPRFWPQPLPADVEEPRHPRSQPPSAAVNECRPVRPDTMAQDAVDKVNWVNLHFGYLTPLHLWVEPAAEDYDCRKCDLGRTIHSRLFELSLAYSANQTRCLPRADKRQPEEWLASYGSNDSLARVRVAGQTAWDADPHDFCSSARKIAEMVIWAYGGRRESNDRLLCLQNVIAKSLRGNPEDANYAALLRMANDVGRQKEWLWESYWGGNLQKHFERVARLMDVVSQTRDRYDEQVQSLTKSLTDNTLAAVAVVVASFVAAIFRERFNATVFRAGVGLYGAYVLFFPGLLGLLNLWQRFHAARQAFNKEVEAFREFLDARPVCEIVKGIQSAEGRFKSWFLATAVIYLLLVALLALGAAVVPSLVLDDRASEVDALQRLESLWNQAHINADAGALSKLWADDFTAAVPGMARLTKADAIGILQSGSMRFQRYETTHVSFRFYKSGEVAVSTGRLHRTRRLVDRVEEDDWLFTKTYVRIDGHWQVIAYHASQAPPPG